MLADFRPFHALRYDAARVKMDDVIAPPYDVIAAPEQEALYARSPYNCIRLILNKILDDDTPENNRYTRSRDFFQKWSAENILMREKQACFYLYKQTFHDELDGRTKDRIALMGRLKLEPFDKEIVIPHEKTLDKPKADRRKLLEATQTNFSPIFGLYEDAQKEITPVLAAIQKEKPIYDAKDDRGVRHMLWAVSAPQQVEQIQKGFSSRRIYIADGHHRYQTSLDYAQAQRAKNNTPAGIEIGSDFVLTALIEFRDPGLLLLPTHRMILDFPGFDKTKALESLRKDFKVEAKSVPELRKIFAKQIDFETWTKEKPSFGLIFGNEGYLLTLQNEAEAKKRMPAGKAEVWYRLNVAILSHFILGGLWNLPETSWENTIRYTHDDREAIDAVQSGKVKASFLVQGLPVEILREMGRVKELMPQKSTYFHPKLASGLLFNSHLS